MGIKSKLNIDLINNKNNIDVVLVATALPAIFESLGL